MGGVKLGTFPIFELTLSIKKTQFQGAYIQVLPMLFTNVFN